MLIHILKPKDGLNSIYQTKSIGNPDLLRFADEVKRHIADIDAGKEEEYIKNSVRDLLAKGVFGANYHINIQDRKDMVIRHGSHNTDPIGVIIEFKRLQSTEMVTKGKFNAKALHELVRYYMHERHDRQNPYLKHLVITNGVDWYIFKATDFERLFFLDKKFLRSYTDQRDGLQGQTGTDYFYKEIAKPFIDTIEDTIEVVYLNLATLSRTDLNAADLTTSDWVSAFKILSPQHLLKQPFANDSNTLDREFYNELLHILGLEEVKDGGKKLIKRKKKGTRDDGSLLENCLSTLQTEGLYKNIPDLSEFGDTDEEQIESIALELCITWLNRILFMKLLEGQLIIFNKNDKTAFSYAFMRYEEGVRFDYDQLNELFFNVLAIPVAERQGNAANRFDYIPYLNSSLFEMTKLEGQTIRISNLKDHLNLPLYAATVLKNAKGQRIGGAQLGLQYLLQFLDAYNFAASSAGMIQYDDRRLINAAVLGLIFEKLNGYRDGSFFTPGFITMYMCRETVRRAVVQKFNDKYGWDTTDIDSLNKKIERSKIADTEALAVLQSVHICDPAVGSGHFLVSVLNELLVVQAELFLLTDINGNRLPTYSLTIENDELIVRQYGKIYYYDINDPENARMQRAMFEAKRAFIEGSLFGVDINPKSVAICQLRLWIELLKHAYYTGADIPYHENRPTKMELETLPNIDINIKTGNSLISRFNIKDTYGKLNASDKQKVKLATDKYKTEILLYKNVKDTATKQQIRRNIAQLKTDFANFTKPNDPDIQRLRTLKGQLGARPMFFTLEDANNWSEDTLVLTNQIELLEKQVAEKQTYLYGRALEWRFDFPEVLDEDGEFLGFDAIVGNPPYIQLQSMGSRVVDFYKTQYKTFARTGDIFYLFFERVEHILAKNGQFAFITNAFDKTAGGVAVRELVQERFKFQTYLDLTGVVVFVEATTYPVIITAKHSEEMGEFRYAKMTKAMLKEDEFMCSKTMYHNLQQENLKPEVWQFLDDEERDVLAKIKQHKTVRAQYGKCYYGIKTGLNEAFIVPKNLLKTKAKNVLFAVHEGKDLKKWVSPKANKEIIVFKAKSTQNLFGNGLTTEAAAEKMQGKYTEIMSHLDTFIDRAEERTDQGEYWWELRNCAYYELFEQSKIVFPNLQNTNKFSLDDNPTFLNAPAVFLPSDSKYLLGVLNSKVVWHFLKAVCVVRSGGYIEVKPQYFEQIPIPELSLDAQAPFVALVDRILADKAAAAAADTGALEAELDGLVYQLYDLTMEEIAVIEGT